MIDRYLPYTITLRAPALIAAFGDDPGSARTLSFIPGASIRGQVAQAMGDPAGETGRERLFRHLILDGSVCYLNAYPRAGGRRTLPTPVSFQTEKNAIPGRDGVLHVCDLAAFTGKTDEEGHPHWPQMALSSVPESFVSVGGAQPVRLNPRRASRVHQQRDRSRGRAWKEPLNGQEKNHGSIFTYEYLEPDQEFEGIVHIHAATDPECTELAQRVTEYLKPPILLGRSRRGGYGGDPGIQWQSPRSREVEGADIVANNVEPGTVFRALLTSHYVGRNHATGQIDPGYLLQEIEATFSGRVSVVRKRWKFETVGGFNRKWRLEIPQVLACAAGSVVVLEALAPILHSDLLAIENAGLGERRIEGFGRISFLTQPIETLDLQRAAKPESHAPPTETEPEAVCFIQTRILRAELSRAIAVEAAQLAPRVKSPPSPSLLGRLRTALRGAPETGLQTLRTWLDEGDEKHSLRRPALDQLERGRIDGGKSIAAWIREIAQLGSDEPITRLLRFDRIAQRFCLISEDSARKMLAEHGDWIRARLIDALLEALARRGRLEKNELRS